MGLTARMPVSIRRLRRRRRPPNLAQLPPALARAAHLLAPGAAVAAGDLADAASYRVSETYLPLPSPQAPRVLVPMHSRNVASAAVTVRRNGGGSLYRRVGLALVASALQTGALQRVARDRLNLLVPAHCHAADLAKASLADYLGDVLGGRIFLSPKITMDEPHRSLALYVLSPQGRLVAFVKAGWNELTRQLVRTEAAALEHWANVPRGLVQPPQLLHHGRWHDLELAVMAPLSLRRADRPRLAAPPWSATLQVAESVPRVVMALSTSTYWKALCSRVTRLHRHVDAGTGELLTRLVTALDACGEVPLAFGAWHGDWLPWNFRWRENQLVAWDWEYWSPSAPVGFDVLHFYCGISLYRNRRGVDEALRVTRQHGLAGLPRLGVEVSAHPFVYALYVLELLVRRLDIAVHSGTLDLRFVRGMSPLASAAADNAVRAAG
jgi:hypothetical protein